MFFMHPLSLCVSLLCACVYGWKLNGSKALRFQIVYMLPVMLMATIVNMAFNHEGATILLYLPTGNPLTLESILYGLAAAVMLAAVITWFSCYTAVFTSDKFVYLFGRIIPALSLVLSMTLRFVPRFKQQFRQTAEARRCVGRSIWAGSLSSRIKNGAAVLSIMVTWSLENAIETADSMKSRGYGLPGRTAFSIYQFDVRDKHMLVWLLFCGLYVLSGALAGGLRWQYYPVMQGVWHISFHLVYLALCLTPVICDLWEDRKWKFFQSNI